MVNPTFIYFVRHGHVDNPKNILYGRLPGFRLSEMGREQAQAAATALREVPFAAAFSSPQLRARQTAEIILAGRNGLEPSISPLIDELDTPYEGRPISEVAARKWDIYTGIEPQYEQPADLVARLRQFIAEVRRNYTGQPVLAVTHGDLIAFLLLWVKGFSLEPGSKEKLDTLGLADSYPATASITTFTYQTMMEDETPGLSYARPY
jgi:broad specificity phosphatase PhoE